MSLEFHVVPFGSRFAEADILFIRWLRFGFISCEHVRQRSPVSSLFLERGIIVVLLIPQQRPIIAISLQFQKSAEQSSECTI